MRRTRVALVRSKEELELKEPLRAQKRLLVPRRKGPGFFPRDLPKRIFFFLRLRGFRYDERICVALSSRTVKKRELDDYVEKNTQDGDLRCIHKMCTG